MWPHLGVVAASALGSTSLILGYLRRPAYRRAFGKQTGISNWPCYLTALTLLSLQSFGIGLLIGWPLDVTGWLPRGVTMFVAAVGALASQAVFLVLREMGRKVSLNLSQASQTLTNPRELLRSIGKGHSISESGNPLNATTQNNCSVDHVKPQPSSVPSLLKEPKEAG